MPFGNGGSLYTTLESTFVTELDAVGLTPVEAGFLLHTLDKWGRRAIARGLRSIGELGMSRTFYGWHFEGLMIYDDAQETRITNDETIKTLFPREVADESVRNLKPDLVKIVTAQGSNEYPTFLLEDAPG
eukprot:TRINITY_DN6905_c0_g1_i1.p1 TRINITY_DN6905_c0_g1~~TRINITY_DN6905_c0_g1_i1.p1  ORF type:complete len:130 (-),score=11.01 TRINITY_DN6905_c0_g1_i1:118-507(-)